ncbi:carboxypeptidase-like regulatory domain-containing protein [uncultured Endozoicomonas sp.]|uniref:carboxypeptidase-like regulatory domain-containing protein n=1 Tax=uncultured Endozoicomonas sp. TaxID=432652 RepID=UPI002639D6D2|nr:carboxypeptidase-like regulatory domain-containing protein [uncultured Endozoicomonas sp.]
MKAIKQLFSAIAIASVSLSANADLELRVDRPDHDLTARVYMDNKPVKGATVVVHRDNGFNQEMTTDDMGRANFTSLVGYGPVTIKASKDGQDSNARFVFLNMK